MPACVRGQYGPGSFAGQPLAGYRQERGPVNPNSNTETFLALGLYVRYVAMVRRAVSTCGPANGSRNARSEIAVAVQIAADGPVPRDRAGPEGRNQLVLRVQPDEGIALFFDAKVPGDAYATGTGEDGFPDTAAASAGPSPEAYERLLLDAMLGDSTLFIRSDEVEYSWRFMTPLLEEWAAGPPPWFPNYEAGTWGPPEADALFDGTDGGWRGCDGKDELGTRRTACSLPKAPC